MNGGRPGRPEDGPAAVDLLIVPGADHADLYDRKDLIPFEGLDEFFTRDRA
ncbi:hypothetical protein [Streptomyces pilosus]|uniref:Alpha/beta hydrolase n=1 Tax=Streptomyces pilosus TaxID=28893 RepID=A0A918BJL0_9ACTN|nr:hypothetical protein [Streptomyces pilosus]GGQ70626.1 hypothetical protein GCM10010280_16490 [Streptomyces pilosus]